MYTKRIRITNYGPFGNLDLSLPFKGANPKPVVLVGGNGSGKTILLSHIVNGLIAAKDRLYPDSPEIETNKVFKIRSPLYISSRSQYYFSRVDYEHSFHWAELQLRRFKKQYAETPQGIVDSVAHTLWETMEPNDADNLKGSLFTSPDLHRLKEALDTNCLLYLPSDRFEDPAWLNQENLTAQTRIRNPERITNRTIRQIICHSPLQMNMEWLFDVIYDRAAFETRAVYKPTRGEGDKILFVPALRHSGPATTIYDILLQIVRLVTGRPDSRFGIGRQGNRIVSIESQSGQLVPNLFQMSSGEVSLLNLGMSILRDSAWCDAEYRDVADIRGTVLIDEIDLHLHAYQQIEVLPKLLQMFPKVQFIVTSHSALFVLGMQQTFNDNGFGLYQLPDGNAIAAEEFSEFYNTYSAFTATDAFTQEMRRSIEMTQRPMLVVEGLTDQRYLQAAARLLCKQDALQEVDITFGDGSPNLSKVWNGFTQYTLRILPHTVLLLYDCDHPQQPQAKGRLHKRSIPLQPDNPIQDGIENLFGRSILAKALKHKPAFIDIEEEHTKTVRGLNQIVQEKWAVNDDEKSNLCEWICANGTAEDFDRFTVVFELLDQVFGTGTEMGSRTGSQSSAVQVSSARNNQ